MTYSKEPISLTLTTFTSETLQAEAIKLFKVRLYFLKTTKKVDILYNLFQPNWQFPCLKGAKIIMQKLTFYW